MISFTELTSLTREKLRTIIRARTIEVLSFNLGLDLQRCRILARPLRGTESKRLNEIQLQIQNVSTVPSCYHSQSMYEYVHNQRANKQTAKHTHND